MADAFGEWMGKVDAVLLNTVGVGASDLADAPYRDYYDDEMSPREAAQYVLEEWNDDLYEMFFS